MTVLSPCAPPGVPRSSRPSSLAALLVPPSSSPESSPGSGSFFWLRLVFQGSPPSPHDGGWGYQSALPRRMGAALPLCSSIRETRVTR